MLSRGKRIAQLALLNQPTEKDLTDTSLAYKNSNANNIDLVMLTPLEVVENVEITIEDFLNNPAEEISEGLTSFEFVESNFEERVDEPDFHLKESELNSDSDSVQTENDEEGRTDTADDGNYNKLEKTDNQDDKSEKFTNKRKRNRKANEEEWSRQKTKAKRMTGEDYVGYTRNEKGEVAHNKVRSARKMGRTCISKKCLKYKNRSCSSFSEEHRKLIFKKFWEDMSWDQKKMYVTGLMEMKPTQRKYVENSRRSITYNYFLKIGNERKRVCKTMFLSTLGLKEWMIANWCKNTVSGILPATEVRNNNRKSTQADSDRNIKVQIQDHYLKQFLEDLPKMPSHYCRKDSNKQYLEFNFESKANLYKLYQEKCVADQKTPLSSWYFSEVFENLNLAIFVPKKDQCNTCVAFKAGNIEGATYNRHIVLKELARKHKDADTIKSKEDSCHVFVMDVQAVKMCPVNNANKFYFKTRLKVHNFTIYNLKNHECCNYWWSEIEGSLCSSVFATIIIDHLHEYCRDDLPIIIWSDGCSYQNRNNVLSNALLQYAVQQRKVITQKYLEPGHTQMQCDAVHSLIERKLKNKEIVMPYDYVRLTREARQKPSPLLAKYMTHDMFRNYEDNNLMRYRSIRPGRSKNDPTVKGASLFS